MSTDDQLQREQFQEERELSLRSMFFWSDIERTKLFMECVDLRQFDYMSQLYESYMAKNVKAYHLFCNDQYEIECCI